MGNSLSVLCRAAVVRRGRACLLPSLPVFMPMLMKDVVLRTSSINTKTVMILAIRVRDLGWSIQLCHCFAVWLKHAV